jgi:hypothetical protein
VIFGPELMGLRDNCNSQKDRRGIRGKLHTTQFWKENIPFRILNYAEAEGIRYEKGYCCKVGILKK